MNLKLLLFGGLGNSAPMDYVQIQPINLRAEETDALSNPTLDAAKKLLGTKWVLHPDSKPRDMRKLHKAKRKKQLRGLELKRRKELKKGARV